MDGLSAQRWEEQRRGTRQWERPEQRAGDRTSLPLAKLHCTASGLVVFSRGIALARVLKPLNLRLPGAACGLGLTLLTPTRYIFGMTMHRRLSSDTHMSPLAGRSCLRGTRQRYLWFQLNKTLYCHLLETCHNSLKLLYGISTHTHTQ